MLTEIFIKSIIIGILASIPIGPIAIYVLQKSINGGHWIGFRCSLGATIVDTIFATIAVFAFSAIAGFIESHTKLIEIIGGVFIIAIGFGMMFSRPTRHHKNPRAKGKIALDVTKSTLMGLSNPGALAVMFALFAAFKMDLSSLPQYASYMIIACVTGGSLLYWFMFTWLASKGNRNFRYRTLLRINQVSGVVVVLFGIYLVIAGIL